MKPFTPLANLSAPIHPPVPAELLTTADGAPGLDAEYFDGVDFKTSNLTRVDANIDFDWGMKPPIDGLKSTDYSVRWTGRITTKEPVETVTLIPMGAARLRLAALPVIGTGPDAREWQPPPEPLMSYSRGGPDPYEAMFDGKIPRNSNDPGVPRFTTYGFGGAENGKLHWVRRNFDQKKSVSSCEVYWVDEASPPGDVRLPKSWRVLYLSGKEWKEVENPSGYGIAPDKSNSVTFKPVKTTALRLDVQCQEGRAMGIYEWQIK